MGISDSIRHYFNGKWLSINSKGGVLVSIAAKKPGDAAIDKSDSRYKLNVTVDRRLPFEVYDALYA